MFSVCVCSLRYSTRKAHAPYYVVICCLSDCAMFYFPNYLIERRDFRGRRENLLNTNCVFWFPLQLWSETFLILRRTDKYVIMNVQWCCIKHSFSLSHCNENWIISTEYFSLEKYSNIRFNEKNLPVGAEMFHPDRRTDMTKL